jgi:hypothetical protein
MKRDGNDWRLGRRRGCLSSQQRNAVHAVYTTPEILRQTTSRWSLFSPNFPSVPKVAGFEARCRVKAKNSSIFAATLCKRKTHSLVYQ